MQSIPPSRIQPLQTIARNAQGRHVVYWMQQSQRTEYNHALEYAVQMANARKQPLLVVFGLTHAYPEANWRHFAFMLEGLHDVRTHLAHRRIPLRIDLGDPAAVALKTAGQASILICDRGYLSHQRKWRRHVALNAPCPVIQIESDVVIPVEAVSSKAEYAARTIRSKIHGLLPDYLQPMAPLKLKYPDMDLAGPTAFDTMISRFPLDRTVKPVSAFLFGGYGAALKRLKAFLLHQLPFYDQQRNHPHRDGSSMMSPYLHFGQISPLEIALAVKTAQAPDHAKAALLEELIVRRELAINNAFYNPDHDNFNGLPRWTRLTLIEHSKDPRTPIYTPGQLEAAATHDPYWNAAMREMKHTGYMHGYMRMYWGKKILQWRPGPQDAFDLTLKLNNKYFVDGRDPNSYTGVGWVYGLHDRPWKERPIYGKIRYMARSGLERKFDMPGYITKVDQRIKRLNQAQSKSAKKDSTS